MNLIKLENKLIIILVFILVSCKNEQAQQLTEKVNQEALPDTTATITADIVNEEPLIKTNLESSSDGYWKRASYYKSVNEKEYYYHPRVQLTSKGKVFCFLGITHNNEESKNNDAYLYVLDESKKISVIDTLPIHHNIYNYNFMSRQYSNIIIKNGIIYYYKELPYDLPENSWKDSRITPKKEYYSYNLKRKGEPVKINKPKFLEIPNRISFSTETHVTFLENTNNVAINNTYDIRIIKNDLWQKIKDSLAVSSVHSLMKSRENEVLIRVEEFPSFNLKYNDTEPCEPEFGGVHWDSVDENLYFDNSGPCYACIWKLDVKSKKVTKIVPEHEAIHPFHYRENNKTYVAYVYKGQLQIAEPTQTIDIPLKIKSFNPNEYQLSYNLENSLYPVSIYRKNENEEIIEEVILEEGQYFIGSEVSGIEFKFSVNAENKITGSYRSALSVQEIYEEYVNENQYDVKQTRLQIVNSKITSEYTKYEDHYSLLKYNYTDKTAKKESFTLDDKLKSVSNYLIEDDEYEGMYLNSLTTTHYYETGNIEKNEDYSNNKTSFYDNTGKLVKQIDGNSNETNFYNDTGALVKQIDNTNKVTYIYNDNQILVEAIVDGTYVFYEPTDETMRWHIKDKNDFDKHLFLKPNVSYRLNYNEDVYVKFETNENALIEGEIVKKNKGEIMSISSVSNSVLKTWKQYKNNKLVFDAKYNAKDSIFFLKSFTKKDSIIERHVTTFVYKKDRYKKITKNFYKSGRYKIIDELQDKTFLYDANGDKISTYTKENITYTEIYKEEKLYRRTYANTEGDITEYFKKGKLYRKEVAYFNEEGILFLKLYNGKNELVKDVEMPVKNNKPVPSKVKL